MRNASHVAIGLCFVLLGAALLLDRLGLFDIARALHFWPLALVLIGLGMIVQALRGRAGERSDFPVGAVFVLILIGLFVSHAIDGRLGAAPGPGIDPVRVSAVFSGRRAAVQDPFREAHVTSVMGGTVLDLRQAIIPPGGSAVVDVFALMGGAVLYVPREWVVDVQTTAIMGGVKDDRAETQVTRPRVRRGRGAGLVDVPDVPVVPVPGPGALPPMPADPSADDVPLEREDTGAPVGATAPGEAPRLIVRGFVMMGGLNIKP
jgi:hypothetical protein